MGKISVFNSYLKNLHRQNERGDAREESFYPALKEMLESKAAESGLDKLHLTPLPRPTEADNSDLRLWDGEHIEIVMLICPAALNVLKTAPPEENLIINNGFSCIISRSNTKIRFLYVFMSVSERNYLIWRRPDAI